MLNVKKTLTKILSLTPMFEYVGNYGSAVFNTSWTAPDNGVAIVKVSWNTAGVFGYWYIKEDETNLQVASIGGTANGTSASTSIPIIKGHTYRTIGSAALTYADFFFYKIKLGGVIRTLKNAISNLYREGVAVC